jgi:molybdopterin synthase sulfur carrier subunit
VHPKQLYPGNGVWLSGGIVKQSGAHGLFAKGETHRRQIGQQVRSQEELSMAVTIHLPGALREFAGGQTIVEVLDPGETLADVLGALWRDYPAIRDRMATEQGQVREHINVFIGDENSRYTGGLMSPVANGSEVTILPAVSGG